MSKKELEMIFSFIVIAWIFAYLLQLSITSNSEIQDLKNELALTKLEEKQKCNERFLGIKDNG